jgi:hypothetical protein
MSTLPIRALKPHVNQEEALRAFSAFGFSTIYWRLRSGPLQGIAEAYVPFWIYRVRFEINRAFKTQLFAMDAVRGALDLFQFPHVPEGNELTSVETRNRLVASLEHGRAEELLREKVMRVIFQQGFFKVGALNLVMERVPGDFHLPYWLAFYGSNGNVRCRVMDAVRRRMEGAKASAFFEQWLAG